MTDLQFKHGCLQFDTYNRGLSFIDGFSCGTGNIFVKFNQETLFYYYTEYVSTMIVR